MTDILNESFSFFQKYFPRDRKICIFSKSTIDHLNGLTRDLTCLTKLESQNFREKKKAECDFKLLIQFVYD